MPKPSLSPPPLLSLNDYVNIPNKGLNLSHFLQWYGFHVACRSVAITQNKYIIYQTHDSCKSNWSSQGK